MTDEQQITEQQIAALRKVARWLSDAITALQAQGITSVEQHDGDIAGRCAAQVVAMQETLRDVRAQINRREERLIAKAG